MLAFHVVEGIAECTGEEMDTFAEVADRHANEEKNAGAAQVVVEGCTKFGPEDVEDLAHRRHEEEVEEEAHKKATVAIVAAVAVEATRHNDSTLWE